MPLHVKGQPIIWSSFGQHLQWGQKFNPKYLCLMFTLCIHSQKLCAVWPLSPFLISAQFMRTGPVTHTKSTKRIVDHPDIAFTRRVLYSWTETAHVPQIWPQGVSRRYRHARTHTHTQATSDDAAPYRTNGRFNPYALHLCLDGCLNGDGFLIYLTPQNVCASNSKCAAIAMLCVWKVRTICTFTQAEYCRRNVL